MATYTDIDGNVYTSVIIGTQEWIIENFKAVHYKDGSDIPLITDPAQWVACGDTIPSSGNCFEYGCLYNWWAANNATSILPAGWHIPTQAETIALRNYLDPVNNDSLTNVAGALMKEIGTTYWIAPNSSATNSSGFTARASGLRDGLTGAFQSLNEAFHIWNSYDNGTFGGVCNIDHEFDYFQTSLGSVAIKKQGRAVRGIKDDSIDPGTVTDIDSNTYNTVKIGTQVWMKENLRVEHYSDGTAITKVTDNTNWKDLTTEAFSYYSNADCIKETLYKDAYCWYNNLK